VIKCKHDITSTLKCVMMMRETGNCGEFLSFHYPNPIIKIIIFKITEEK